MNKGKKYTFTWCFELLKNCTYTTANYSDICKQPNRQMKKKITTEIIKCRKSMQEEINVIIRSY